MPAFKRFGPGDQVDNVLVLQPKYDLVSGSAGWRGSPNASSSLSLYGGARRSPQGIFSAIRYESHAPNVNQTGHPTRGEPLTASVNVVWLTDEELGLSQRSRNRWGREHWDTVRRLYQDYQALDPDFVTGTYDHYCVFFQRDSANIVAFDSPYRGGQGVAFPSGSWCIESWVKPLTTASLTNDFTIASMNQALWIGITGSTGQLKFSSSLGGFTASIGPTRGEWSHVAVMYDSTTQTGAFRINLAPAGTFSHAPLVSPNSLTASFTIGQMFSGTMVGGVTESPDSRPQISKPRRSFHGMIGETRFWFTQRSDAQLSASWNSPLVGRDADGAFFSTRFNEGPLFDFGSNDIFSVPLAGSGTLNQRVWADLDVLNAGLDTSCGFGFFAQFDDRVGPVWLPNDNVDYYLPKQMAAVDADEMEQLHLYFLDQGAIADDGGPARVFSVPEVHRFLVIDVPSSFYGREIVRNGVSLTCNAYSSGSWGLARTLIDDGRGGLFVSGSMASGSSESYRGVEWNKVGNVFYGEGLIVIKEPALLDFGRDDGAPIRSTDTLQLTFRGDSRVPVKTLMCRVDRGEFNATLNPTFRTEDPDDGSWDRRHTSGNVRVTTVGLYNSDRELVGVARLADPVRIRSRDRINIRLRMDF